MRFYIIDCFAEQKYQGNELLVILADRYLSDEEQQKIAREINFSETVFIFSKDNNGYNARIWTPNVGEIPFAGHPTLGAAYVIHKYIENCDSKRIFLNLKIGQISIDVNDNIYTMRQKAPAFGSIIKKHEVAEVFGICPDEIRDDIPIQWVSTGLECVVIPLKNRNTLSKIVMNREKFSQYIKLHPDCNCNHLFFADLGNYVFSARCFMEDFIEDPATGSANGCLAGYMLKYDYFKSEKISYTVRQGEDMGRNSILKIHAFRDEGNISINVGGKCQTVAFGQWL